MRENGRSSCTVNSRHIHIRYFIAKYRVNKDEVSIEFFPTESMLAYFFTKPLQGKLFKIFRAVIMGWDHIDTPKEITPSPDKELIGGECLEKMGKKGKGNRKKGNGREDGEMKWRQRQRREHKQGQKNRNVDKYVENNTERKTRKMEIERKT